MTQHMIKLVVGCDDLADFARRQQAEIVDYEGQPAVPCWTRFKPKRADEILRSGGSIYRVINNRIQCRLRILGFEMVEVEGHGTMCMIMQDPEMIETVSVPQRPFQGWRYFDPAKAPKDKGIYNPANDAEIPPEMAEKLRESGLL